MGSPSACASCKWRHVRCSKDCTLAPYFPSDDPQKFEVVHNFIGDSRVRKILQELPECKRSDAAESLVYEAKARARDPVNGIFGFMPRNEVSELQKQLDVAQAQMNHEAVKGGTGKEASETASGVAAGETKHEAGESSNPAAVKLMKFPYVAQAQMNHEAAKGREGEKAFETASGVAAGETKNEAAESSDADAVKRMKFPYDLNQLPSDEDEDIIP